MNQLNPEWIERQIEKADQTLEQLVAQINYWRGIRDLLKQQRQLLRNGHVADSAPSEEAVAAAVAAVEEEE